MGRRVISLKWGREPSMIFVELEDVDFLYCYILTVILSIELLFVWGSCCRSRISMRRSTRDSFARPTIGISSIRRNGAPTEPFCDPT
jgi:hypothetical protein